MKRQLPKGIFLFCSILIIFLSGCAKKSTPLSLRVGIPHSDNIQDLESNYYINWLENQTGIDIIPVEIRQTRCDEYLDALFSSDASMDIVLFGNGFVPSTDCLNRLIEDKRIYQLQDGTYTVMNYGATKADGCGQVMWINSEWLGTLSLEIPRTTEELRSVLLAFKNLDPNGNGIQDEIPLIGSTKKHSMNPLFYLLNAYTYCDPYHTFHKREDDKEIFVPETEEFLQGMCYCRDLYSEGLLDERTFFYTPRQLSEIVNNSSDLIGAFTSESIGDVIYQGNPEIMAKYICILPLEGPSGIRNSLYVKREPVAGAIIVNGTGKEKLCEELLDKMMSTEGSLISRFGEQDVDWEYSDGFDVSIYGKMATITTKNYLWNISQNKHLNGIGPMYVPGEYLEGVTWNGVNSDLEYIDARAEMNYRAFFPKESSQYVYDEKMVAQIEHVIEKMISGGMDIDENAFTWDSLYTACHDDASFSMQ